MRQETVRFFTAREAEIVTLLTGLGMKKNIAKVIVFLENSPDSCSRDIERGCDLRQSEVSLAMKYLTAKKWVRFHNGYFPEKGRPRKVYSLETPLSRIVSGIEAEKKSEARGHVSAIRRLQRGLR